MIEAPSRPDYILVDVVDYEALQQLDKIPENKSEWPMKPFPVLNTTNPARQESEDYESYRLRQKVIRLKEEAWEKGVTYWNSRKHKTLNYEQIDRIRSEYEKYKKEKDKTLQRASGSSQQEIHSGESDRGDEGRVS